MLPRVCRRQCAPLLLKDGWITAAISSLSVDGADLPDIVELESLLTSLVPPDIQGYIFQLAESTVTYETVRDKVVSLARNRITMSTPVPMDIGNVQTVQ